MKTLEFILQMDELYAIILCSVKLFEKKKAKRCPIHKHVFSIDSAWAAPRTSVQVLLLEQHSPTYFNSSSSQNSMISPPKSVITALAAVVKKISTLFAEPFTICNSHFAPRVSSI